MGGKYKTLEFSCRCPFKPVQNAAIGSPFNLTQHEDATKSQDARTWTFIGSKQFYLQNIQAPKRSLWVQYLGQEDSERRLKHCLDLGSAQQRHHSDKKWTIFKHKPK